MKIFICIDSNGGISFNGRRQSRDRILNEKIEEIVGENKLFVSPYSSALFSKKDSLIVCDNPFVCAKKGDFCFLEEDIPSIENIDMLYLINWNRSYPFDKKLSFSTADFHLVASKEFAGSSHEKITLEVYEK